MGFRTLRILAFVYLVRAAPIVDMVNCAILHIEECLKSFV